MSSDVATSNCGDTPRESLIFQRARGLDCRRVRESAGGADPWGLQGQTWLPQ